MASERRFKKYIALARKAGAREAKLIAVRTIATAPWVRLKCQYGCGGYGERLTCPPYSPPPDQTARILKDYRTALLIHGDRHTDVTRIAVAVEREAFLDGHYKAFALGSGPCRLCDQCALKPQDCRHPYEARPALEACGIDVYRTARNNGCPIQVVRNHQCRQNYYGVVLLA